MKKISVAIVGFYLIARAVASPAPELPAIGKYYNIYAAQMRHIRLPPEFYFDDPTSPEGFSKTDKGHGGYYDYYLGDDDYDYHYQTTVCFQSDKRISLVSYNCLKGGRGRFFSPRRLVSYWP
jgi:hypothetical protein